MTQIQELEGLQFCSFWTKERKTGKFLGLKTFKIGSRDTRVFTHGFVQTHRNGHYNLFLSFCTFHNFAVGFNGYDSSAVSNRVVGS